MKALIRSEMTVEPFSITKDVTIGDAQEVMRSWGMRHLPVVDGWKLVGVVSDRDIQKALATRFSGKTEVQQIMSAPPYHVGLNANVAEVAQVMAQRKIGCAIVTNEKNEVLGIFTTTDALNLLAKIILQPAEFEYARLTLADFLSWPRQVV